MLGRQPVWLPSSGSAGAAPTAGAGQGDGQAKVLPKQISELSPAFQKRLAQLRSQASAGRSAAVPSTMPAQCRAVLGINSALQPDRFHTCSDSVWSRIHLDGLEVTGEMEFDVVQWATYGSSFNGAAPEWDHGATVISGTGVLDMATRCSPRC